MTTREAWADVAKGIGILLVVLGHNAINSFLPVFHQFIYSFHMPLFFMLSGMFFKPQMDLVSLIKRRFRSILLPYLIVLVLIYTTYLFFSAVPIMQVARHFAKSLFFSLPDHLEWMPLWFLPHLFLLNIFVWLLIWLVYKRLPFIWFRLLFLLGLLYCGVLMMHAITTTHLSILGVRLQHGFPWGIDLLPATAAFFILGYEIRRSLPAVVLQSNWTVLFSGLLWVGLNWFAPQPMSLASRIYGFFPTTTFAALSGSLFVLSLGYKLEQLGGVLFTWMNLVGQISMLILIFHGQIQYFTFYKMMDLVNNVNLSAVIAFIMGAGIPILIWALFMRGNPRLAGWFGVPVEQPIEQQSPERIGVALPTP